jgi:hypothetical protein
MACSAGHFFLFSITHVAGLNALYFMIVIVIRVGVAILTGVIRTRTED